MAEEQKEEFSELWQLGEQEEEGYRIIQGVLYSVRRPHETAAEYPRLVLPQKHRNAIILRAHKEVGHMASAKTLARVREAYVWPGMRKDVFHVLETCPTCKVHTRKEDRVPMGAMPIAAHPMQIVGMDLISLTPSERGSRYALVLIDHCTGWAEAHPLKDKSNKSVWEALACQFFPRHGVPEVMISDNGQEFCAHDFEKYLKGLGVEHRRTTPVHQC
jgi:transposase InsO family protein